MRPSPSRSDVTVHPRENDDILYNPGMGFADSHFGFGHPPPTSVYPRSTVAYFRWSELISSLRKSTPSEFVDRIIEQAQAKGETLTFRIMTEYRHGSPQWLIERSSDCAGPRRHLPD
jgi:hypothetical protein